MTCISVGGDGVDVTLSRLTPEMFLRILANVDSIDPSSMEWDYIEDRLVSAREYSNSNPLAGQYAISIDGDNTLNADSAKIQRSVRDVGEEGYFYLFSIAQSAESLWHTLDVDGNFDPRSLLVEHECIKILGGKEFSFDFLESIRYNSEYSESRDASDVGPITCYLIDDKRNVYSLSDDKTYDDAWENGQLNSIAIQNLTKLIECTEKGASIWQAAKALRGKLYLFDWLSEVENSAPPNELEYLVSRATEDLEAVQISGSEFEEYVYESRQFLSYIYARISGDKPNYDKSIACLSQALEGEFPDKNARFAAETLKLRAEYFVSSKKPALAMKDYKEAISRYELLKALDSDSQEDLYQMEMADCKLSLGLLMEKYGGDFITQLSEAVELNPACIQEIVRDARIGSETVDAILSCGIISRDTLKKAILVLSYNTEE